MASSRYNLRKQRSPKDSDQDMDSSPRSRKREVKSPNASGYSSSHSYRDRSKRNESNHRATDSQDEDYDEGDYSYPSTTFSPSAATPSPKLLVQRRKGAGSDSDSSAYMSSPSSSYSHRRPMTSPESEKSPTRRSNLYPELPSDSPPSARRNRQGQAEIRPRPLPIPPYLTAFVGLAILLLTLLCFFSWIKSDAPSLPKSLEFTKFASEVDRLRDMFPSQETRTWRSIKSSVKHILNGTDPEYPAVVLFAVRRDIDIIGSCLARRVASLFNSITGKISDDGYFDARLMSHLESQKQKEDLDEKIHSHFKTGRSVVIDHLEALSPKASLLLHGTCDNDNAPWKNVFIGIVFYVDKSLKSRDVDTELTRYFEKELDMDKIGALLTRINNNPVVITEEDKFDFTQCH